jgi:membrane fusion protein, type I secretion system
MKNKDGLFRGGGTSHRWANEPNGDGVGPQGAALILELQRLRQAFEHEERNEAKPHQAPYAARRGARRAARRRTRQPKNQLKGKVGRVIDVCLEQFGLSATTLATRRSEHENDSAYNPPPRRHEASFASDNPSLINLPQAGPERGGSEYKYQSMYIESPPIGLPSETNVVSTATTVMRLVRSCRSGLAAGAAFLIGPDSGAESADAESENLKLRCGRAFENELRMGLRVLLAVALIAGGWAVLMPLAGAVVVPGNLVVQSNVKTIQHPTGGVVAEIAVRNGQHVGNGDLLLRLDATQAQASLQMVSKQLDEIRARIARLIAERDGLAQLETPAELTARSSEANIKTLLLSEETLFKARASARRSQIDLLQSKVSQLGEEIAGLDAQVASKTKQLELITGELSGVQELYDKRLVPLTRLTALQRESARIEGERGQLVSAIAETKSKIGEARLQIVRIDQDFRTDVVKELGENRGKEAELVERAVAARDLLDRIEVRAPTSGVINQLAAHTVGGVVRAGDQIMEVVPDSDDLQIEARLQPNDIDQVRTGQKAFVRFSAFNQRVTPQLTGAVTYVSADISHDPQTNAPYFTVRVALSEEERRRMAGLQLVPGMPAEVFMQTGSRTMMNYLLKPLTDQMRRAFVEQ